MADIELFNKVKNLLFIDIETASGEKSYQDLSDRMKALWDKKGERMEPDMSPEDSYFKWAPILPEFGKIISIGVGFFYLDVNSELNFRTKSIDYGSEADLLNDFLKVIGKRFMVAHNGLLFDYPYIAKRMMINRIELPDTLNFMGKKPWEIRHIDTMNLWKFGDLKSFASLELLATIFDLPSSKGNMDGSQVNTAYYIEDRLQDISEYCLEDVVVTARVYLRLFNLPDLLDNQIVIV